MYLSVPDSLWLVSSHKVRCDWLMRAHASCVTQWMPASPSFLGPVWSRDWGAAYSGEEQSTYHNSLSAVVSTARPRTDQVIRSSLLQVKWQSCPPSQWIPGWSPISPTRFHQHPQVCPLPAEFTSVFVGGQSSTSSWTEERRVGPRAQHLCCDIELQIS